jgi:hypothetical protein
MAVAFDFARSDRSSHEEKYTTRALDPCATSGVAIHFSPLFMDEKNFRKAKSIAASKIHVNPPVLSLAKAPYTKSYFGGF